MQSTIITLCFIKCVTLKSHMPSKGTWSSFFFWKSLIIIACHNNWHKPLWNKVKFIDHDPYYDTHRVKEAIRIRLHPNNINGDSGIEIPEALMPMIKKHNNRRAVWQQTTEGANHWVISKDQNAPIRTVEKQLITAEHHAL